MKGNWKWVFILLGVFLVVFVIALPFFGFRGAGFGYGLPMMGFRSGGCGFLGNGFNLFGGGLMMLGMILIPLVIVALLVFGAAALIRKDQFMVVNNHPCANCGKPVQTGWVACPHCGEKLS